MSRADARSSLCDADTVSEHKVHVPHFSGKNRVEVRRAHHSISARSPHPQHYIRKTYPTLNATFFYPAFYMQNMLGFFKPTPLADGCACRTDASAIAHFTQRSS